MDRAADSNVWRCNARRKRKLTGDEELDKCLDGSIGTVEEFVRRADQLFQGGIPCGYVGTGIKIFYRHLASRDGDEFLIVALLFGRERCPGDGTVVEIGAPTVLGMGGVDCDLFENLGRSIESVRERLETSLGCGDIRLGSINLLAQLTRPAAPVSHKANPLRRRSGGPGQQPAAVP